MTTVHMKSLAVAALFVLCLALAACGSEITPTPSQDTQSEDTDHPHVEPTSPPAQASGSVSLSSGDAATALSSDVAVSGTLSAEPAPAAMLSANNATRAELQAGFEAAGISNPSLWACEVDEYRPYPEDDPDLTKLRTGLTEHNADPGIVDALFALLELP